MSDRPARMSDVAALAGVSKKTVSEVVNGIGQVSAATRQRVLSAVTQLDFRPNPVARRLNSGRSGVITLVLPHLGSSGLAEITSAVFEEAEAVGLGVLCEPTGGDSRRELSALHPIAGASDGVLIVPSSERIAVDAELPVVVIGDRTIGAGVDQVVADRDSAIAEGIDFLRGRGRTRIAVVGPVDDGEGPSLAGRDRVEWLAVASNTAEAGYVAIGAQAAVKFDAFVAAASGTAIGVLHALQERGVLVPDEIAVVAIGVGAEVSFATPSVTTVGFDARFMAREAIARLQRRIAGENGSFVRVDVPSQITLRESAR